MTTFRAIFAAVAIATALLVGAFLLHQRRPRVEREQPSADLVRATGKCASCHREETGAIVHEYETSRHAAGIGFALHLLPVAKGGEAPLVERILYGAPPFAPLLFVDLALLGALAVWDLREKGTA